MVNIEICPSDENEKTTIKIDKIGVLHTVNDETLFSISPGGGSLRCVNKVVQPYTVIVDNEKIFEINDYKSFIRLYHYLDTTLTFQNI